MTSATLDSHLRADPPAGSLDLDQVLARASRAIRGAQVGTSYGLSLIPSRRAPETIAATDSLPVRLDWLQYQLRQGPLLSPAGASIAVSRDLADDRRWPDFGRLCVAALDVRSLVSLRAPLPGGGQLALTFLSADEPLSRRLDLALAVRLLHLARRPAARLLARYGGPLKRASDGDFSRVAVAVNIAMAQHGLDSDRGFQRLVQAAREWGRPLLEVALQTVVAGRVPSSSTVIGEPVDAPPSSDLSRRFACPGGPEFWHDRTAVGTAAAFA